MILDVRFHLSGLTFNNTIHYNIASQIKQNDNAIQMYDALAANNSNNRLILSRIKWNNAEDDHQLCINADRYDKEECYYSPEGTEDMGWLGYFVVNNKHLRVLTLIKNLMRLSTNHSLQDWDAIPQLLCYL